MILKPVEEYIIKQYRRLEDGKLVIIKRHGLFASAETRKKWDKRDVQGPRRKCQEKQENP